MRINHYIPGRILYLTVALLSLISFNTLFAQDSITDPEANRALSIVETVEGINNFIDQLSLDSIVTLPFGIRKQIGAVRYVVAIDSCKFKPAGAYFNAYAAIDFPGSTKKLAFKATNIKFNPKGVVGGSQSRLLLVSDHTIKISNLVSLKLKSDGSNWIEWDCGGYKAINLKGYFIFNKDKLIPDTTQTKDTVVTASFQIYTTDLHEFVTQVSITPFQIRDLKNWSFKTTQATVDMSELINSPGMTFPVGYKNPNAVIPQMWTGFYLQSIKIKLPSEISKEGKRTEIMANNLLIDNMGVTGLFQINNLLTLDEGSMSGWDYSIDELGAGFLCNKLNSGLLKGKVNIPVMDSSQSLAYSATICYNPTVKEADYNFMIQPANKIKFNIFSAEVNLTNTSQISVKKHNGLFEPVAILNGYIGFNHSNFNTNGGQLQFQNLTFITKSPFLTQGIFTLHNIGSQTKTANYPTSVNDISLGINLGAPVMGFGISINILDKANTGFSTGTRVELLGKIDSKQVMYTDDITVNYTKTKWKFDKLVVKDISLGMKTCAFSLNGTVSFKENDPVYGSGFYGKILFSIPDVLPSPASVTACFGSKTNFRYFYVDAVIPTSIPLGSTPISISKIMGGLYYHMKPQKASQSELIAASQGQQSNVLNALTYVPDSICNLGFKAGVGFKYTPNTKTANGDVMLEVAFTKSGGISFVQLGGNIYFMTEPQDKSKSSFTGTVNIKYDVPNKVFDADATVIINAYNGNIKGSGFAKMHIEQAFWYACIGKPSSQNTINLFNIVNAKTYFMVGDQIEPAYPPPPEITSHISSPLGIRDAAKLQSGAGICSGASLTAASYNKFGFDFFEVYGNVNFTTGFDMMMFDYGTNGYCQENSNEKVGLNGRLATGSMYIYFYANVGVSGKIAGKNFNLIVFNSSIAGMASGKLPKPLYLEGDFECEYNILGLAKGEFDFHYTYGSNCTPVKN